MFSRHLSQIALKFAIKDRFSEFVGAEMHFSR